MQSLCLPQYLTLFQNLTHSVPPRKYRPSEYTHTYINTSQTDEITMLKDLYAMIAQIVFNTGSFRGQVQVARPIQFTGRAEALPAFMRDLYLNFEYDKRNFPNTKSKVIFALSYMKGGSADQWSTEMATPLRRGMEDFKTWEDFEDRVKLKFHNPYLAIQARDDIKNIKHGTEPALDFFVEFDRLAELAGLNDPSKVTHLRKALKPGLVNFIDSAGTVPVLYSEWKSWVLHLDVLGIGKPSNAVHFPKRRLSQ